jgi:radical SAM protein
VPAARGREAVVNPYGRAPFIVIWETTRACALACVHCRAEAIPHRDLRELTTGEGRDLIDAVRDFGTPPPLLVLTGGDPLRRRDITDLVRYGVERGLSVSLTPSATGAATEERLRALRDAGLARLAVSLDGATAEVHDAFRGVRGSHRHTLRIVERARALGLPLQINTTVCRRTAGELPALVQQLETWGIALWALFFLIPVGRAVADQALGAGEIESVLEWAAGLSERLPFPIKTTEAPHYQRVLARRAAARPVAAAASRPASGAVGRPPVDAVGRAPRAVTDGNGFVFVDHVGNICPSGFLPLPAGNVRTDRLVDVYREDPLFRALRDPSQLGGRCGVCEYRDRCGGSRARAYAATGDPLAEDPGCAWQPGTAVPVPAGSSDAPLAASASRAAVAPARADIDAALETVLDPELGMSVMALGLVYDVAITAGAVRVTMTLTAQGCPLHEVMSEWVRTALMRVPGVRHVEVVLTFDPPWTPDRIRR